MSKKLYFLLFIFFSFFITCNKVNAAECIYQTAIAYSDADVNKTCYDNYQEALSFMNSYASTEKEVAVIKRNGKIINAKYAIAKIDVTNEEEITSAGNDGLKTLFSTSLAAYQATAGTSSSNNLTTIASTWGSDAAFLDYDNTYNTVRIKISGVDGWIKKSQAIIIPISKYYGSTLNYSSNTAKIKCNSSGVTLREKPTTSANAVTGASSVAGNYYEFYPSKTVVAEGYTWYYVKTSDNKYGYYANNGSWFTDSQQLLNDTFYYSYKDELYHRIHKGDRYADVTIRLGSSPFYYPSKQDKQQFLTNSTTSDYSKTRIRYFSFDGNYFYSSYKDMIIDYRNGNYNNSINKANPYYAYFMYLPSRSKTSYTKDSFNQLIINKGYTGFPVNPKSYVNPSNGTFYSGSSPSGSSMMFGIGKNLIDAQNTYGTNALIIYGNAVRESATGTSAIAFYKNNLFGINAVDGNAFNSATTYSSIEEGVMAYAKLIGAGNGYSNLNDYRYNGTHEGNKLSGKGVRYATDPYSGESTTQFVYAADAGNGRLDEFSYTIGIKNNKNIVNIYAEPSASSRVIYQTKNNVTGKVLTNMPFVITDYIDGFYKVYTDVSLNADRYFDNDKAYDFNVSYGYIKESDLYVQNNYPVITATDQVVEATKEFTYKPTAEDYENGDITSRIVQDKQVDTSIPASFKITYSVTDNEKLTSYKSIIVTVKAPNTDIKFNNIETPQYVDFNPLDDVTAIDSIDGDITNKITVEGSVDTNVMGTYKLTYKVTNSSNIETTKERTVTVIENERPVITASNRTVYKTDSSFDYLYGVTAYDKEDGDLTSRINYTGEVDLSKNGAYQINYTVIDNANQETTKTITITVEDKKFISKSSIFHLENLTYIEDSKKFNLKGFIIIKGMNNLPSTDIKYDIIFENQENGGEVIKPLSRLTKNIPFDAPSDSGYINTGSWFSEDLDLSDLESGDYTIYIRARSGDYEAKTVLKNLFFNKKVVKKINVDGTGYSFKSNFYNKQIPLELFVRKDGLITNVNNPTDDNMYNQIYDLSFQGDNLTLQGTSHNVNGNYGITQDITRELYIENINTKQILKKYNIGSITNGPYVVSLKVSDNLSKTKAWYKETIDLSSLPKGRYTLQLRTKTGSIDDYGEIYDILFSNIEKSHTNNDRKYSIVRNNNNRYRLELIIE